MRLLSGPVQRTYPRRRTGSGDERADERRDRRGRPEELLQVDVPADSGGTAALACAQLGSLPSAQRTVHRCAPYSSECSALCTLAHEARATELACGSAGRALQELVEFGEAARLAATRARVRAKQRCKRIGVLFARLGVCTRTNAAALRRAQPRSTCCERCSVQVPTRVANCGDKGADRISADTVHSTRSHGLWHCCLAARSRRSVGTAARTSATARRAARMPQTVRKRLRLTAALPPPALLAAVLESMARPPALRWASLRGRTQGRARVRERGR
jgi:hypothetical protein